MSLKDDILKMKAGYQELGPMRFSILMIGILAWIGLGVGPIIALDYPSAFGSSCHRKCLIESYWYSPTLISDGRFLAYLLFAWLWSMPAVVVAALIYRLRKRDPLANPINRRN